ncbi:MAG: Rhodanese- sulfurtransferase [Phylliscum demangeonii]|nr:MAG: Rhodanese- sulfurtransferase [Phylliscum demangeonii]
MSTDAGAPALDGPSLSESLIAATKPARLPIAVTKPIPYTFDLGHLLATDANPLTHTTEDALQATSRDGAQALINQLLSTCAIASTPAGVLLTLPAGETALPREKAVPAAKELTRWQRFAAKKGIVPKRKEGKLVYDEQTADWRPKWGFQGMNRKKEEDWLVEVDEEGKAKGKSKGEVKGRAGVAKKARKNGGGGGGAGVEGEGDARALSRLERKERVRRNERRMRANDRRQKTR